jgi:predicted component of type VI protein secretion system
MLHEVRRMTEAGSEGGRWVKLDPGDAFPVGPYTLRFELGEEGDASTPTPAVLRDPAAVNEEKDRIGQLERPLDDSTPSSQGAEPEASEEVADIFRDPLAVTEEKDRTAQAERPLDVSTPSTQGAKADASEGVPNILRDRKVDEGKKGTAKAEPPLDESKPSNLENITPRLQPQPED